MRKQIIFFITCFISLAAFAQMAPQKDFTEKLAQADKQKALALLKAPKVYNGSNFDLKYQRMHWNINPDTLFISGEVTSWFKTTQPSVTHISFDFSSVMFVDSVKFHNNILSFSHNSSDELIIYLPYTLSQNYLDSVSVFYHGNPPQGTGFGSFTKMFTTACLLYGRFPNLMEPKNGGLARITFRIKLTRWIYTYPLRCNIARHPMAC